MVGGTQMFFMIFLDGVFSAGAVSAGEPLTTEEWAIGVLGLIG